MWQNLSLVRSNLVKNFPELPTEYWNTQTNMAKVLQEAGRASKRDGQESRIDVYLEDHLHSGDVYLRFCLSLSSKTDLHIKRVLLLVNVHKNGTSEINSFKKGIEPIFVVLLLFNLIRLCKSDLSRDSEQAHP